MDKYQEEARRISKELKDISKQLESQGVKNFHNEARSIINFKYGKGWRARLDLLSLQEYPENHKGRFNNMSHY